MSDSPLALLLLIGLALVFAFLCGVRDCASVVATVIASRALSGRKALTIAAIAEFIGPFLFGVAVATTIGKDLLNSDEIQISVVIAALIAAIVWNLFTLWLGLPSSSSHALVGGLIGAAVIESGWSVVQPAGLAKVLLALAISPPLGLLAGYLVTKVVLFLVRGATPSVNTFFKRGQIPTSFALALSHGTNDAQKAMGVIALGLVVSRCHTKLLCAAVGGGGLRGRDCIRRLPGRLAAYQDARWQVVQDPAYGRVQHADRLVRGDPLHGVAGRTGEHDTGRQLGHHGGRLGRAHIEGALECGRVRSAPPGC